MQRLIILYFFSFFLWSCEGPEGAPGKQGDKGEQGEKGEEGESGPQGETGNANVLYTDWKTIPWSSQYSTFSKDSTLYLKIRSYDNSLISVPELTEEVLGNSAVFIYKRFYRFGYTLKAAEVYTQLVSGEKEIQGEIFKEGMVGVPYQGGTLKGKLSHSTDFRPGVIELFGSIRYYNAEGSVNNEELIKQLIKRYNDAIQYRILIIKGGTQFGRLKNIDFNDYEAVKKALDIKD